MWTFSSRFNWYCCICCKREEELKIKEITNRLVDEWGVDKTIYVLSLSFTSMTVGMLVGVLTKDSVIKNLEKENK